MKFLIAFVVVLGVYASSNAARVPAKSVRTFFEAASIDVKYPLNRATKEGSTITCYVYDTALSNEVVEADFDVDMFPGVTVGCGRFDYTIADRDGLFKTGGAIVNDPAGPAVCSLVGETIGDITIKACQYCTTDRCNTVEGELPTMRAH